MIQHVKDKTQKQKERKGRKWTERKTIIKVQTGVSAAKEQACHFHSDLTLKSGQHFKTFFDF